MKSSLAEMFAENGIARQEVRGLPEQNGQLCSPHCVFVRCYTNDMNF
jgi:hypothetical protein